MTRSAAGPARAQVASTLQADVRVRVEPTLDGGLDARMQQLRRQCPGWEIAGDLRPDLVVLMFSRQEREAGVYYGADQDPRLESRWEPAVDAMIARFRGGRFTAGVVEGLDTLTISQTIPAYPVAPPVPVVSNESNGIRTAAILLLVLLLAGVEAVTVGRQRIGGATGSSPDWWSSSRRRRSFGSVGSFGSRFGRRRHSSSAHSSTGGSRRSGGGSKRW